MTSISTTSPQAEERQRQPLLRRFRLSAWQYVSDGASSQIALVIGGLWAIGALVWLTILPNIQPFDAPVVLSWPVLALLFFVAERFIIDVEVREQTHSFSLSEIALILALIFAAPVDLLVGQALGAGVALAIRPGQRPIKLMFNVANFALCTGVALLIFRSIVPGPDPLSPLGWFGAFVAAFASDLVAAANVALIIWLSQHERPNLKSLFGFGSVYTLVAPSIALIASTVLWSAPQAWPLLVALAAMTFFVLRFHGREMRRVKTLSQLHESTRHIQESFSLDDVARALLSTARDMFEGELAELLLFPQSGDRGRLLRMDGEESVHPKWSQFTLDPREGVWARIASEGRGLVVRDTDSTGVRGDQLMSVVRNIGRGPDHTAERILEHFRSRGIRGSMIAPLRVDDAIVGTLLVANRRGSWTNWSNADLTLLETLANHAGVAIQNSRQADELASQRDELERRSTHDSLTGLPNRVLFHRDVEAAIAADGPAGGAVLLLDLDRFKEVNDTLGHHNGDRLLVEVAERLARRFGDRESVARLGGDEFAVLLRRTELPDVTSAAEEILAEFDEPFVVQGVTVQVEASLGITRYPSHGDDADTLLRRADVAMYQAKGGHTRYAIYEPQRDPYSEARLALLGELKRAIEKRELQVFYQPQADARSGRIESLEALVRWRHPQRGELMPDEFVALAEHSEVIHELTSFVLDTAVRQCAEWRDEGLDVRVAVNLSARSLHSLALADEVARVLTAHELPADKLTLEITETSIEADPAGTEALLERLHEMGVSIAIDDFGTGYSAFSYLQRLPIDEIKIDKTFVIGMESDKRKAQIVRSTVQLAHNLELRTVAEGVESEAVQKRLARLGCELVQGYHVSRAMSGDMCGGLLRRSLRPAAPVTAAAAPAPARPTQLRMRRLA
jgi:diguanylate cyclase (GGDEF)-like protein